MVKILFWQGYPTHYQSDLHRAVAAQGADVHVGYFGHLNERRLAMGWEADTGSGIAISSCATIEGVKAIPDWRDRIHIIPMSFRHPFLRTLPKYLSRQAVHWVHWSEPSKVALGACLLRPLRRSYARLVNARGLGAFGIGRRAMEDFAAWGVDPVRIAFLPYSPAPADPNAPADPQCAEFQQGRPAFLYLGALCRRKAIDVILSAFAAALRRQPDCDWVLILVGNDLSGGQYEKQARELGIKDKVLFRGAVPPKSLSGITKESSVVLLPSRYDGWGVTLNEGASLGKALIGSDWTGSADYLIEQARNGYRVKAGDVNALASAMYAYMASIDQAALHGQHSLEVYKQFSAESNAKRFLDTLGGWLALEGGDGIARNVSP